MAVRFDLFRLSLTPRQPTLFDEEPPTREAHIRSLFAANHQFQHFGNTFVYLPAPNATPPLILGQVGRPFVTEENLPPEQGFALAQREAWKAAVIAVDPRGHPDGQKLSFQREEMVGEPYPVLTAFVKYLNSLDREAPYHLEAAPIFSPTSFWAFAEENKGSVTSVTFEFVTPNMFGGSDELSAELRAFRTRERAQKVAIKLRSDDGLDTDTDRIRESVEYVRKGAGKITARARRGRRYNSTRQTESLTLADGDASGEPLLERARRNVGDILGLS